MSFVPCKRHCEKNKVTDNISEVSIDGFSTSQISNIVGIHWKLIELNGNEVSESEAHFILHENGNISGNTSCNRLWGTYIIENENSISFSPIAATRRACPNIEIEHPFLKIFETADNYTINDDNTLSLNRVEIATLARFVAVQ